MAASVNWDGLGFYGSSDARTKTSVRQVDGALDKPERIRGVAFERAEAESPYALGGVPEQPRASRYKAVDYHGLTSVLIEAAKELKAKSEALRSRIEAFPPFARSEGVVPQL